MDAENILCEVAEAIYHSKLEAVMIGNAAAAIQGAPVTTMDIDFCIKDDETEIAKLKDIANELNGEFFDYYPFFQIQVPEKEIYLDFLCRVTGVESFDYLLMQSDKISFDDIYYLNIAKLEVIIESKKAVGEEKDLAVLPLLIKTLELKNEQK